MGNMYIVSLNDSPNNDGYTLARCDILALRLIDEVKR